MRVVEQHLVVSTIVAILGLERTDLDVFTETRTIVVPRRFGITKSLHDRITSQDLPLRLTQVF